MWASDVNAKYGWKEWNKDSNYVDCKEELSFKFTLSDDVKVLDVHKLSDLDGYYDYYMGIVQIDFEKLMRKYDAMEVYISPNNQLYWDLYGYDCDSIIVFNKDVIEVIGE